jgi:hypothetical protein
VVLAHTHKATAFLLLATATSEATAPPAAREQWTCVTQADTPLRMLACIVSVRAQRAKAWAPRAFY